MIFEQRIYTCRVGTVPRQLDIYRSYGATAHIRHLGQPVLFAVTEVGALNTYVHVWAFDDLEDRRLRRTALYADPEWLDYLRHTREAAYLIKQQNSFLSGVDLPGQEAARAS